VLYLLAFAVYIWTQHRCFVAMSSADFGTFLSGVFAPLASLARARLFQQGDELRTAPTRFGSGGASQFRQQQKEMVRLSAEQLQFEREKFCRASGGARRRAQPNLAFGAAAGAHMAKTLRWTSNWSTAVQHVRRCLIISEIGRSNELPGHGDQVPFSALTLTTRRRPRLQSRYNDVLGNPAKKRSYCTHI